MQKSIPIVHSNSALVTLQNVMVKKHIYKGCAINDHDQEQIFTDFLLNVLKINKMAIGLIHSILANSTSVAAAMCLI